MIYIPFIYFFLLSCYLWFRHKTFDVSVYMSSLYTVTSFCAILLVLGNNLGGGILYQGWEPELGVAPTFLYCFLITVTILPFSLIHTEKLTHITNNHPLLLYGFVGVLFLLALLNLYLVADSTRDVLNGDLNDVRMSHYQGEQTVADVRLLSMPGPVRFFYTLYPTTILALPLFFYYTCVEKRSLWLTSILLLISLSVPLRCIQAVDRTEIILYGQMFLFCLIFFRKVLTSSVKRLLFWSSLPVLTLVMMYLTAVSTARFEDKDGGTVGSTLQYAGQSYLNFCYFYDNANPDLIYPQREFPILSHVIFKSNYSETKDERSAKEGFFIGVFATHVGAWLLDIGLAGCIIYTLSFALVCILLIKYYNRKEFEITEVLLIFIVATLPIFGIFYSRFYNFSNAVQYLLVAILYFLSRYHFVWSRNEQSTNEQ